MVTVYIGAGLLIIGLLIEIVKQVSNKRKRLKSHSPAARVSPTTTSFVPGQGSAPINRVKTQTNRLDKQTIPRQPTSDATQTTARPIFSEEEQKMNQLVGLVYDKAVALRHISSLQTKHPGRSRLWCIEKAIDEIVRGRAGRRY